MTQYAKLRSHLCHLADETCWTKVVECYSQFLPQPCDVPATIATLEAKIPRYKRGAQKGQRKGTANIVECVEGGWIWLGPGDGNGRVLFPGTVTGVWLGISNGFENVTFAQIGICG